MFKISKDSLSTVIIKKPEGINENSEVMPIPINNESNITLEKALLSNKSIILPNYKELFAENDK